MGGGPLRPFADDLQIAHEVDVVVVGSGAAGFSAALSALREGAEVLMLEKAPTLGGTTIKSSCWAWYPNHAGVRVDGQVDEKQDALRYMARLSRPEAYDPASPTLGLPAWRYELLSTFYDHAAEAAEALEAAGVHQISLPDFPDYYSFLPENRTPRGRTLKPATPDGEPAGADEFIRQAAASVQRQGGRILTEHAVRGVLLSGDAVAGVVTESHGEEVLIRARRGVVFGSGGFAQNESRRADHLAAPILGTCAAPGNTGDFLDIAEALGSPLRNMTYPWMTLMVLEQALSGDPGVKSLFHPPGDSMLFVNGDGDRTLNEKAPYNEMAQMLQRWDVRQATYPELFQFMVWDQACQDLHANERPANPIRPEGHPAPHVVSGATLDELAQRLTERVEALRARVPRLRIAADFADHLKASVARFNEGAREGRDPDFHRGETPIEQAFNALFTGGTRDERNPVLFPLAEDGPYHATIIVPAALDTKGGPQINRRAEVVRFDGTPVRGLYGAGNCVASPAGKSYWAAGATIGPAVTFGYIAGASAARAPVVDVQATTAVPA
jgi:succinate dehydrogenase/fumarate reductase flavoprotein subunit